MSQPIIADNGSLWIMTGEICTGYRAAQFYGNLTIPSFSASSKNEAAKFSKTSDVAVVKMMSRVIGSP